MPFLSGFDVLVVYDRNAGGDSTGGGLFLFGTGFVQLNTLNELVAYKTCNNHEVILCTLSSS